MTAFITSCLLDWSLDSVFSITVDNAGSNSFTVKEMSKQLSNWGINILEGQHLLCEMYDTYSQPYCARWIKRNWSVSQASETSREIHQTISRET